MRFASRVFWVAAIYGLVAMLPLYFAESMIGQQFPPALNHPEFYYSFIGVGLAWQVAFVFIAREPVRLRPIMIPAMLEKLGYAGAQVALYLTGRLAAAALPTALLDIVFAVLFWIAFQRTREQA